MKIPDIDIFYETYDLVPNTFAPNASFDGYMHETYGEEWDFVALQPCNRVWTITEYSGNLYLSLGFHTVNRIGYLVTEQPHKDSDPDHFIVAEMDDDDY